MHCSFSLGMVLLNKIDQSVVYMNEVHMCDALGTIHKQRRLLGGGRGVAKMGFWGDFQGLTEATGGGRGVKNCEN